MALTDKNKIVSYLSTNVIVDDVGNESNVLDYMASIINNEQYRLRDVLPNYKRILITSRHVWSPELLAYDLYGTEKLNWLINRYNGMMNPLHPTLGFCIGNLILYPLPTDVANFLKALNVLSLQRTTTSSRSNIVTV